MGLEGIIAKRLNSTYKGSRDDSWLKIKCQRRQAFVVGGFAVRAGSTKEVGSLLLGVYDKAGRLRYAGSVGTGWDAATGEDLLRALCKLEADQMPFDPAFPPTKGRWSKRTAGSERWVKPSLVVEVGFAEWTPDGHVRHPSFQSIRQERRAALVRREDSP
jgi:bifunctional non-homologous end joining protein LigD